MPDRTATTPHPASIRAFVARRPVAAFLILAFAIAYPVMALVALAVHRVIPVDGFSTGCHFRPTKSLA